jgi:ABC-type multidrug transport system ATPase subunit
MTTQTAQAIRVQGLEKSYKELRVLRGVDFDVARGSIFALLGSNGAGKTTVVKILSTLLKADAGSASVNGFDVATQPASVRESISLTGSSPPSTRSSAGGRISCSSPGCGTSKARARSPMTCSSVSR